MTTITAPTGLDPQTTIPDLRTVLEDAIVNHPRSLQTALGPSEIGTGCDRCLIHLLAGHKANDAHAPWLPTVGTAVHAWAEQAIWGWMRKTDSDRYITEGRVTIGQLRGLDITGSSDVFDIHTGTVVDFKIVGTTTMRKVAKSGPTLTYQNQIHSYGTGWLREGFNVASVAIWYLPRNHISLDAARVWQVPHDPSVTERMLARANQLAAFIDTYGVDTVLAGAAPHTSDEFSCGRWPGEETPVGDVTPEDFLGV